MTTFTYNDLEFTVELRDGRWDVRRGDAYLGASLFPGATEPEAAARALALVRTVLPVGVKCVGPDVAHPTTIGDLKIVGPDVAHPNFITWDKDSVSCPRQL